MAAVVPTWAQTPASATSANTANPNGAAPSQTPTSQEWAEQLWQEHQRSIILAGLLLGGYLGVLWLRPLWLLKLPSQDISVPWTTWKLPLGLVRWLKYRNRVLDAWVNQHWQSAAAEFAQLPTVQERCIHIGLPVYLNKQLVENLSGEHLAAAFAKKSAVLLITGEGGAGKTSLACQMAQWGLERQLSSHRMLPVLIETELDAQKSLVEAICGQLNALTHQSEPIAPELLDKLLHRQRLLVIVDHLSEMSEATRQQITPELADFPAKALVVTSRLQETLGGLPKTVLAPLRIEGSRLSRFMDAYLEQRQKRDLFEDEDYFDACRRLSRMVGQRNITILLARLYVDQMIEQQQGSGETLPASVPELMLSYLNQLNRTIEPENQLDRFQVWQAAQQVAWQCLKQTYRPTAAARADMLAALKTDGAADAETRLTYLDQRLRLLQTVPPGDKIRVVLDPLAEYLAALCLVDYCRQDPEQHWPQFLDSIDPVLEGTNDTPEAIQGFLLAVRDCCLLKQKEAQVPDEVPETLARKAGLDPEELRRIEAKRRIRLLISDLSAPELEYRLRAAADLAERGAAAAMAVPNLLGMVENPNQNTEARIAAAQALGKIGGSTLQERIAPRLMSLLTADQDELAVRRSVTEALGEMKAGRDELLQVLKDDTQPLTLRQGAARAVGLIGAPSGEAVPMLVVRLQELQVMTQVKEIRVWREPLAEDLTLDLVRIPAGEFLMGSPPDEVGRDVYFPTYSDTEGKDVEMQHRVTVPEFWLGQSSVTQAQWRWVAGLPQINRVLEPNPAQFKGNHRPVEQVSWDDAVEFCQRLSQYTGKTYRLPSEAEWEYACRAGTTSPFYVGETLSTEIANYDGNYSYGAGEKGIYREQTTDAGSFGVNEFGLADMHGNVYDWCLDHWHPSYEGAPTDGSAWVTDGNENYRLVRGGSWYFDPDVCRSAVRDRFSRHLRIMHLGLRVVCVPPWTL